MGTRDKAEHKNNKTQKLCGVFSWDIVANIVCGDSVFAALYGLDPEIVDSGIPVERLLERIVPSDLERVAQRTHESIVTGAPFDEAFSIHRPGMGVIQVKVYSTCFHRVDGVLTHCAGSISQEAVDHTQSETPRKAPGNVFNIASKFTGKTNRRNSNTIMAIPFLLKRD